MKILNTLHDLWRHCSFCPICRDYCRDIDITVGPDEAFNLDTYQKDNNFLYLNCVFKRGNKVKYKVQYSIDTLTNKFEVSVIDATPAPDTVTATEEPARASRAYFFFYFHGDCKKCNVSHCNSSDIELDMSKKILHHIGVEREGVQLLKHKEKYSVTIAYDNDNMLISKCFEDPDGGFVVDNKVFECPIVDFDYSNQERVISKIKTLMIFS